MSKRPMPSNVTNAKLMEVLLEVQETQRRTLARLQKLEEKLADKKIAPDGITPEIDTLKTELKEHIAQQLQPVSDNMATLHMGFKDVRAAFSPPQKKAQQP